MTAGDRRDNHALRCQARLAVQPARARRTPSRAPAHPLLQRTSAIMRLLLPTLMLLLAACTRESPKAPDANATVPPSGGGQYTDAQGVQRTVFRPVGFIDYGETRQGDTPPHDALIGYEFEVEVDPAAVDEAARYVVIAAALEAPGADAVVAIYGPRSAAGLWDQPLQSARGSGQVRTEALRLETSGLYFILLRSIGAPRGDYRLTLECLEGACTPRRCLDIEPCDLVCADGFAVDADGCRLCECLAAPTCQPGDCAEGELCVDGACQPRERTCEERCEARLDPVCGADGRTWPNACIASCEGVEVRYRGGCRDVEPACDEHRPCPDGQVCRDGRCVASCDCTGAEGGPVCSREGRTHRNECLLRCAGETLHYHGECLPRICSSGLDCPREWRCLPAIHLPGNRARCAEDPDSPDCIKGCVPPAELRCSDAMPCPEGKTCYRGADGDAGVCVYPCRLVGGAQPCFRGRVCAAIDPVAARRGEGMCLAVCADAPAEYCGALQCLPDLRGTEVCRYCDCPNDPDAEPVCADGQVYRSACHARCAGHADFRPGTCERRCEACPPEGEGVCGSDGVIYGSRCEAECNGVRAQRRDACYEARVAVECQSDEDCARTGCEGSLCASAPARICPAFSPVAACFAEHGQCGCVAGRCQMGRTRESVACYQALQEAP